MEEQPQYIYATNGYVDHTGGPPPVYYINGESLRFRAYEQLLYAYIAVMFVQGLVVDSKCVLIYGVATILFFLNTVVTISFVQKMIRINS